MTYAMFVTDLGFIEMLGSYLILGTVAAWENNLQTENCKDD